MERDLNIKVEVVYATAEYQKVIELQVPAGSTVREVIELSGVLQQFPQIDIDRDGVGVFGKQVEMTHVVSAEERVELYRPLKADPKQARREKANTRRTKQAE